MDLEANLEIRPATAFAHASEAELARILDFYAVAWEYEPHTFPILFDRSGAVVESFSPDFYLPELDLYVELTTLKQRLVRKKNRKLRRLCELYPGVRIKLLYARDFRALLFKYGKLALADALTGAEGQTTPPKARPRRPAVGTQPGRASPAREQQRSAPPAEVPPAEMPPGRTRPMPAATGTNGGPGLDLPRRSDHARRRGRRTRAEARARAVSRSSTAAVPGGTEITA